jgi:hypothetical protein
MSQRNWIILAVVVIVLVGGYVLWPSSVDDAATMPAADAETTAPAE